MYVCIVNQSGEVLLHRDLPAGSEPFLQTIEPYQVDLAVAVESLFSGTVWPSCAREDCLCPQACP